MQSDTARDFFRSIPLLAGLGNAAVADLQAASRPFSVQAGQQLFRQYDKADGMYLISRGHVRVATRAPGDDVVDLVELGSGDILGEFSLLDGGRRSATAEAVEGTTGFFLSLRSFEGLRHTAHHSAFEVIDRIRIVVARRARAVAAEIASEPVLPGITTLRAAPALHMNSLRPAGQCDGLKHSLAALPTFSEFTAGEIGTLLSMCECLNAPRDTVLSAFDSKLEFLYVVLRGALRASVPRGSEIEQLSIYGPGALVEAVSLIDGGATCTQIDVREDAQILRMARSQFDTLRMSHSEAGSKLLDQINLQLISDLRRLDRHLGRVRSVRRFNDQQRASHV